MWQIRLEPLAAKALKKLDNQAKQRIESFIDDLATTENLRSKGKALQGTKKARGGIVWGIIA
jgi:mRNA-degrading endonuclease RelE of RelBE toxin-antitoxin system